MGTEDDKDAAKSSLPLWAKPSAFLRQRFPSLKTRVPVADDDASFGNELREWWRKTKERHLEETEGYRWYDWLGTIIPFFAWILKYNWRHFLLIDVAAGISVGAMVIPQGMSYANLAGLPYQYGLYGAFVPCIVYALLGSSRQLSVGPVAVTSTLLGSGLAGMFSMDPGNDPNNPSDPALQQQYNEAAVQVLVLGVQVLRELLKVAFLAGCIYTGIGVLRLGWITNFLSHPVISGFSTGAAINIALGQVKYMFGLNMPRTETLVETMEQIFWNLDQFKWREYCMTMGLIFMLLSMRWLAGCHKRLFFLKALGPITVCVVSIALMNIFGWYDTPSASSPYIKPVGHIPSGLPAFTAGWFLPLYDTGKQLSLAALITFMDICESMSIAKALAQANKYELNANAELTGLGIANLAGAMWSCYTTTGSFSRSAVNNSVGAKTQVSGIATGLTVMVTLLCLTGVFENMSKNTMAAIIITGVAALMDFPECWRLWNRNKVDCLVWVVAWMLTMFLGVELGVVISVALTLCLVVYSAAFPHIAMLGRLPGSQNFRSLEMYAGAEAVPGLLLVRVDAPLFFGNVQNVKDFIRWELERNRRRLARRASQQAQQQQHLQPPAEEGSEEDKEGGSDKADGISLGGAVRAAEAAAISASVGEVPIRFVIVDLSPCSYLDTTALHFLEELMESLEGYGICLMLANPNKKVLRQLRRAELEDHVGPGHVHAAMADAVAHATARLQRMAHKREAPGTVARRRLSPVSGGAAAAVAEDAV